MVFIRRIMHIPKKIKIGAHEFDVEQVTYGENEYAGSYESDRHRIQINTEAGLESSHAETLLHELLEAIDDVAELKLPHKAINDISQWLFMIIRDNDLDFRDPEFIAVARQGDYQLGHNEGYNDRRRAMYDETVKNKSKTLGEDPDVEVENTSAPDDEYPNR